MARRAKPAGFVVDQDLNVLEFIGQPATFVERSSGPAQFNLRRMLRPALRLALLEVFAEARVARVALTKTGIEDSDLGLVDMAISANSRLASSSPSWLITFALSRGSSKPGSDNKPSISLPNDHLPARSDGNQLVLSMLAKVKRRQGVLAAALEKAGEELRTSNAQLLAANREIQHTHKELEESRAALGERFEFITAVLDTVGALIVVLDPEGRIVEFNRACERASGVSAEAAKGRPVWSFVDPEELSAVKGVFQTLTRGAIANSYENNWVAKNGKRRRIAWSNTVMRSKDRGVTHVIATGIDITDRERTVKALEASEAKFRAVIENATEAIIGVDGQGRIRIANPAAARMFGYSTSELSGAPLEMLIPERFRPSHSSAHREYFENLVAHRIDNEQIFTGLRKDRTERSLEISLSKIETDEGILGIAFVEDVTERAENRRRLQALTRKLLSVQEEERRRIARDIHDDLTQTISVLGMKLGFLKQSVRSSPGKLIADIEDARLHVDKLSEEVRALSHRLHPSILEYSGLIPALESLVTDLDKLDGPIVQLLAGDIPESIPSATAAAIYRIAQEALRNATKYSAATTISVRIECLDGVIRMTIVDDGHGFDLERVREGSGLGLVSMQERALGLGGQMHIDAAPGKGTRLEVEIPVRPVGEMASAMTTNEHEGPTR